MYIKILGSDAASVVAVRRIGIESMVVALISVGGGIPEKQVVCRHIQIPITVRVALNAFI
jgi:hypothetical protein